MAFDPSSAQSEQQSSFDPGTASPSAGFDPSSAKPASSWSNIGAGLSGAYRASAVGGLMSEPIRMAMEGLGVGMDTLKAQNPGQSDEWYKAQLHQHYNDALTQARQNAQQQVQDNPYPGSQVGNFVAGVLGDANPTYLINPAAGVERGLASAGVRGITGLAARATARASGMAVLNSGADAGAQLMDIAEGQKKDFDVQQNLQNAAFGAAFGGGHAVVSDFVKGLFTQRGTDTTPAATPDGVTSPLTTDHMQMNADDASKYHDLLHNGSMEDIKGFFANRNGPQPSWQDVNTWLDYRDQMADQGVNAKLKDPNAGFNYEQEANSQLVKDHVAQQTANWTNAPDVNVINHPDEIEDPQARADANAAGAQDPSVLGAFGSDGRVHLFADRILADAKARGVDPQEAVNAVLYHEGLGHFGLQQAFGSGLDQILKTLMVRNVGQFGRDVTQWMKDNPDAYGGDRVRAAEEVLAEKSESGKMSPSVGDAVSATVRKFGRQMGLKLSYSDSEVRQVLRLAHNAVTAGKGRDVRANGFRFMFSGPKASGYDPNVPSAFTASDGVGRNEINDSRAGLTKAPESNLKLGDLLHHPVLYDQYPHLRDIDVERKDLGSQYAGAYDPETGKIELNTRDPNPRSTLLHEVQHAIQHHENYPGFEGTDTTKMTDDEYARNPLENEARATESRRFMDYGARTANPTMFARSRALAASTDYKAQALDDAYRGMMKDYVPTTRSWDELRRSALDLGFSPSAIRDLGDVGKLDEKMHRMQAAANMTDQRLKELNERLDTPDWSAGDKHDYIEALADQAALMARIRGNNAEIARALNVAKAASYTKANFDEIAQRLQDEGSGLAGLADDDTFMKFARSVKAMYAAGNPKGAQVKIQGVNKLYWEQYLNTFHFNAMLSGLSTHVKAPLDMMTGIAHDVIDHAVAWPVGKLYNAVETLTGQKVKSGVSVPEVTGRLWGAVRSVFDHEVYVKTLEAAKTGDGSIVMPNGKSISTNPAASYGASGNPRVPGLSIPTDLITAQDTFFRSHAMSQNLYGLGYRLAEQQLRASGKSYTFDDVTTLGASHAHNPSPEMIEQARAAAEKSLLLNRNSVTGWLDAARAYKPNMTIPQRFGAFIAQNLAPFIRVGSNSLITRTIERSPLPLMAPSTWRTLAAGGPDAHLALSKMIYGSIKLGLMWQAAAAGKNLITGSGPDNPNKRKELQAGGWMANAVHEDGQFHTGGQLAMSINPFDMHNTTAQMVYDMRRSYEEGMNEKNVGVGLKLALGSILHDFESESWVNDMSPAFDAASARGEGAGAKVAQFAGDEAKTWVPNIANQLNRRFIDPTQRDTRPGDTSDITGTMTNSIKSAIPGLSQTLPHHYSVYGDETPNGQSITGVHNWVTPGNGRPETSDPTEQELQRLSGLVKGAIITPVLRTVKLEGVDQPRKLTAEEFENYQHLAGTDIVNNVRQEMQYPEWQKMSDQDKVNLVRQIQTDLKKGWKEHLFGQQSQ